jgi:hypothetical protein
MAVCESADRRLERTDIVPTSEEKPPLAAAVEWVGRIMAVGIEMILPGLGGKWLDDRWATTPLLTLSGFGLGMAVGIWHLLVMTAAVKKSSQHRDDQHRDNQQREGKDELPPDQPAAN